jgi:MFS family permease
MSAVGTALGPSLGGIVIAGFGWRAAFVLLAGLGVVALCLALRAFPPIAPAETRGMGRRMDWPGAALLAVTLAAFALATGGGRADVTWDAGWLLAIAILALVLFVAVEARSASPLVPVSVLRDRATGTALATNLLVSAVMMSTLVVGPFFLSFGLGLNAAWVGLVMAVGPVTAALAGVPAGRATDRFGTRRVLAAGLIEMTVGLICLAFLPGLLGVAGYVAALIVLTPGFQLFLAANNTSVMAGAREEQRGVLSGLLGLSRNLGFMTGASVMTTSFAVWVGTEEIAEASARSIADGFAATFLVAAGMTLAALVLTFVRRAEAPLGNSRH